VAFSQVVRITSKGQFTLPVEIRRDLSLDKGGHVYVAKVGSLILIKKVDELTLDDISAILEPLAKKNGVTCSVLMKDIETVREKMLGKKHSQIKGHRSH
jgi:bifunctional DNA-binding transcriptional regulator/antitoxin component of YhaV-PrlF toxin-antitoxin module